MIATTVCVLSFKVHVYDETRMMLHSASYYITRGKRVADAFKIFVFIKDGLLYPSNVQVMRKYYTRSSNVGVCKLTSYLAM